MARWWEGAGVRFEVKVEVRPRAGIADPEGATVGRALRALGFAGIGESTGVRVGKLIEFELESPDTPTARDEVDSMCHTLLSNPVIEDYSFEVRAVGPGSGD